MVRRGLYEQLIDLQSSDSSSPRGTIPAKWGVTASITCSMLGVGPPFYAMYVALPKIMISFSADVEQVQAGTASLSAR
jgi:hypothetical protein